MLSNSQFRDPGTGSPLKSEENTEKRRISENDSIMLLTVKKQLKKKIISPKVPFAENLARSGRY